METVSRQQQQQQHEEDEHVTIDTRRKAEKRIQEAKAKARPGKIFVVEVVQVGWRLSYCVNNKQN